MYTHSNLFLYLSHEKRKISVKEQNNLYLTASEEEFIALKTGHCHPLKKDDIENNFITFGNVHDFRFVAFSCGDRHKAFDFEGVTIDYKVLLGDRKR